MESKVDTLYGTRILPDLYRVGWWDFGAPGDVNCDIFAIDCGDKVVLIDSGRSDESYKPLKNNLKYWGLWDKISTCFITHLHKDHAGGIDELRSEGVSIYAGASSDEANQVQGWKDYYHGRVPKIDQVLKDNEQIKIGNKNIKILYTPGHTSTCVTYLVKINNITCAFTGDMIMPNGQTGYTGSFDFNKEQLISSLTKLLNDDFDAVFTGHMLAQSQPEGFWLKDGKNYAQQTLQRGLENNW